LPDPRCPVCGFRLDPMNDSQLVCPACGIDPRQTVPREDNDEPIEPDIDSRLELEVMIADGEALLSALTEGPILIAGNKLIN
jgi:uncharacterized Zn finger protein (UPF0148 family)